MFSREYRVNQLAQVISALLSAAVSIDECGMPSVALRTVMVAGDIVPVLAETLKEQPNKSPESAG